MKKLAMLLAGCMLTGTLLTGCGAQAPTVPAAPSTDTTTTAEKNVDAVTLNINTGVADTDPAVLALKEVFVPRVKELTNGTYEIAVFSSGQLGDDVVSVESLRSGTLDMEFCGTSPVSGLAKELALLDIPFAFDDVDQYMAVMNGKVGDMLAEKFADNGIIVLGWSDNGFRQLTNSKKNIETLDDLKGLKLRTLQNAYHMEAWTLLGTAPTPMGITEVFTALQTGTVDGQENPLTTIYSYRFQEVNPYITLTNHSNTPNGIFMSAAVWDKLPEDAKSAIKQAAEETLIRHREIIAGNLESTITDLEADGAVITELPAEVREEMKTITAPVWDKVTEVVGQEVMDLFKAELEKTK